MSSGITLQNLTLTDSAITENPCAVDAVVSDITPENSQIDRC